MNSDKWKIILAQQNAVFCTTIEIWFCGKALFYNYNTKFKNTITIQKDLLAKDSNIYQRYDVVNLMNKLRSVDTEYRLFVEKMTIYAMLEWLRYNMIEIKNMTHVDINVPVSRTSTNKI